MYFWWPKAFGYLLNEKLGKWNFWFMLIGFNLTFGPMHILGLQGMSRRIYTYDEGLGFDAWNLVSSIGAFTLAIGVLFFLINVFYSKVKAKHLPPPGPDPWDARSLEWMIQSPPPEYNFDPIPEVHGMDEYWHRKYGENAEGRVVRIAETKDVVQPGDSVGVHLPSPSYWPLVIAVGMPIIGYGLIFNLWLCLVGGALVLAGVYGWAMEPADDPDAAHDHDDHDGDHDPDAGHDGDGEAAALDPGADGAESDATATAPSETEAETVG
jgi:cytochrome c oxidase subunit 1